MSGVTRTVPRGHWLGAAAILVASVGMFAPVLGAPATRILGNFQSEAATHAPALAAALEGLWTNGPFVLADHPLHPERVNGAMFEPVTTLLMWPFYAVLGGGEAGFAFAWNAWQLVTLVGSAVGAGIWARAWLGERDPEGWGAGLAAGMAAASVFVHLSPEVGRTEAQNYPLYALHGGLLFHAVRHGGRAWIGAALSVVPVVWAGGYAAVFFAVTEPLVALWALAIAPDRRAAARGLAGVAAAAVVAVLPLAWALQAYPYVAIDSRAGAMSGLSASLGALVGQSEDPLRELAGYEVAPYAGAATLLAAGLAVARWRGAAWPLGIALVLYAVAAGPAPELGERALVGPAAALAALPGPFGDVRVWARIVAIAIPIFAVAGAAAAVGRGRTPAAVATVAVLGALVEASSLRVGSTWSLTPDARVTALRDDGEAPIPLPLDGIERTRRWLSPPDEPDVWAAMPDHPLFRYLQDTLPNEPELFRATGGASGSFDPCALQTDAVALRAKGFTHLVLREAYLPRDGAGMANRALKAVFGAAKEDGIWPLPERVSEACATGDVEPIVLGRKEGRAADAGPKTPEERAAIQAARRAERERVRQERLRQQQEKIEGRE